MRLDDHVLGGPDVPRHAMVAPGVLVDYRLAVLQPPVLLLQSPAVPEFDLAHRLGLEVAVHMPDLIPPNHVVLELREHRSHLDVAFQAELPFATDLGEFG